MHPMQGQVFMLKVEHLRAGYGALEVLHGISFEIPAQSIVAILGANGAGKTTLMRALTGLIRPRTGTIDLDSKYAIIGATRKRMNIIFTKPTRGSNQAGGSLLDLR